MTERIAPVSYTDPGVALLVDLLDKYQIGLYGILPCNLDSIAVLEKSRAYLLGAYHAGNLIGIGAVKLFAGYAEVKRMYIQNEFRGRGFAGDILSALENYTKNAGINKIYLETGYLQEQAIAFYKKCGYVQIEKFGTYEPNGTSVYFSKDL